MAALWAFLRRVGFIDFLDCDSSKLGFILDHLSKLAIGPLVQPLIHLAAVIDSVTDAANITDSNRRDTSLKEHLHDFSAQLVKEVRDLVVDMVQLLVFRLDELLPTVRSTLFAIYLRIELRFQLVLVVAQSPKLPTVNREGVFAGENSGKVLLPEIDSGDFISSRTINRFFIVLSADNKPAGTLPNLDSARLPIDRPINQNRVVSALCGEPKDTIISERDTLVGPPKNVVFFVASARRVVFAVIVMPRSDRFVELFSNFLSGLRRKHAVTLAVPPMHRRFRKPVILAVYAAPVPLADAIPQVRRRAGQPLQLIGALNMEFASEVHTQTRKPSRLPAGGTGLRVGPTAENSRGQSTQSHSDYGIPRPCLDAQTAAESVSGLLRSPGEKSPCIPRLKPEGL